MAWPLGEPTLSKPAEGRPSWGTDFRHWLELKVISLSYPNTKGIWSASQIAEFFEQAINRIDVREKPNFTKSLAENKSFYESCRGWVNIARMRGIVEDVISLFDRSFNG